MSAHSLHTRPLLLTSLFFLCVLLLHSSCTTTAKEGWNSKIGTYTYNQAVQELGPAQSATRMPDGTTVAEWVNQKGVQDKYVSTEVGVSPTSPDYWYGATPGPRITYPNTTHYLRLTFAPDGRLIGWKKFSR